MICYCENTVSELSPCQYRRGTVACILDEVENRHPVSYRREEMSAIWVEEEIASAVDCSQKV